MFQRALQPLFSKMEFLCISEMFSRSAGLLPGLDDLVDRPSTNKLVGGFSGMGGSINAQQGRYSIFSSKYPDNTVASWAGSGDYPQKFPGWFYGWKV